MLPTDPYVEIKKIISTWDATSSFLILANP